MLSRVNSLLIVLLIWAAIYLPALGSLEIKGEEGRRILPAIRMLETGDYIVPRVGSAAYFSCFGKLLSDPRQWPFPGRVKRPPTDPVNALLSFGYSLLTNKVASAIQLVGFDHFVGYLHSSFYGRPALALDLVEEFRPIIVDSVVLTMLNKRMLTLNDFVVELGAYRLKDEQRKVFFTQFEERLNEEVIHPLFGYKATYRRCLELQARLLAKVLTGEIDEYPPLLIK